MLTLGAAAYGLESERITVQRASACRSFSVNACPAHEDYMKETTESLSHIGLFLSPAGKWACENNDYCGLSYWKRSNACESMNCTAKVTEGGDFCSKRMNGCTKECDCDLGGLASAVDVMLPAAVPAADNATTIKTTGHDETALLAARPANEKRPLVLWLHGYTGQSNWASSMWKLDLIVDQGEGVIVAAPNGGLDDV